MCYLLHTYHQMCPGLRISGLLWEDGQAPSDSCGGFLECSGKMVRPHQTAVEDCWLAPGRWSCPVLCGFLECSGKIDGQAPSDSCGGFLECLGSWLYPSHFIVPLSSPVSQDLNGSDGNPGVLVSVYVVCGGRLWVVCVHFISSLSTLSMYTHIHTVPGGLDSIGLVGAKGIALSYAPLTMVTS